MFRIQSTLAVLALTMAALAQSASIGSAEVKSGDPGATCTTESRTINGEKASCSICSATKCDTSGTTITNCRVETTTTCTIGGRVVNPNPRGSKLQRAPNAGTLKAN